MLKDSTLKRKKKNKSMQRAFVISIILVFLGALAISVNAYERPEFKDGLADRWHPGAYCIPCHYTLLSTEKAQSISNSCKCHDYRPANAEGKYIIDMTKIFNIHKDIVCIRCHVGIKYGTDLTAADFHRIMSKEACLTCHTYENGTYQKPQKTKCSDCHSSDPHVVHGKKLEKMCVTCHGDFAEKYVANKTLSPISGSTGAAGKEYPTIGQMISNFIEFLMGMI